MTRHRRTRKRQRGGFWPFTSSSSDPYQTTSSSSSWTDWFSSLGTKAKDTTTGIVNSTESALTRATDNISSGISSAMDSTSGALSETNSYQSAGRKRRGKRVTKRRKRRSMKGGRGLGLTYYATPVSGIKMAQPTSWI